MTTDARRMAETAARASYGRLLAIVAAGSGDLAAAEDALAEAFVSALRTWPDRGVPDNPEGWLITVARRQVGRMRRHRGVMDAAARTLEMLLRGASETLASLPDRRLELLFVCAHPAIDRAMHTPLMLQTVLGLDAVRIASAFLVAPAAMGQRLVRAKAKIKAAGIAFEEPDPGMLDERLGAVLDGIYVTYGTGWDAGPDAEPRIVGLAAEAVFLARLVAELLPASAEAKGLLALMLHCEARRAARRDGDGRFVPLAQQQTALWSHDLIAEAERVLRDAAEAGQPGRYQIEAAIQSLHVQRRITRYDHGPELVALYDLLVRHAPSLGSLVARAAALAEVGRPADALAALAQCPADRVIDHQPYWATRAHILCQLGRDDRAARKRAVALTRDPAVRAHLLAG